MVCNQICSGICDDPNPVPILTVNALSQARQFHRPARVVSKGGTLTLTRVRQPQPPSAFQQMQAKSVGMDKQYDFIYSHTSRMLHATPFSFIVNQKNLELNETHMFLEYVYVSLLDMIELVENAIGISNQH